MYVVVFIFICALIILAITKIIMMYKDRLHFTLKGMDKGFKQRDIAVLWEVSQICDMEEPEALYWSLHALSKCIAQIKTHAENLGMVNSEKYQNMLSKLYTFRTKIENEADKKRGLESTASLDKGQKLRIILPGKGVFYSEILNNARELVIQMPSQKKMITVAGAEWIGKTISVYLWRKGDAQYVFDTIVNRDGVFLSKPVLFLRHTVKLIRTQKRNAIRAKCSIMADLYIIRGSKVDYNYIETRPGYKCRIDDISEKGALVIIGGKGIENVQIRLQFLLDSKLVVMFGIIRTVDFSEEENQSKLHFECIHINSVMRNIVLSYVYNILPEKEKEIYNAMTLAADDEIQSEKETEKVIQNEQNAITDEEIPNYENRTDTDE